MKKPQSTKKPVGTVSIKYPDPISAHDCYIWSKIPHYSYVKGITIHYIIDEERFYSEYNESISRAKKRGKKAAKGDAE